MPPITIYIDAVVNKVVNETVAKFQILTVSDTEVWSIARRIVNPEMEALLQNSTALTLRESQELARFRRELHPKGFHIPLTPLKQPTLHDFCVEPENQEDKYSCVPDNIELLVGLIFKKEKQVRYDGKNYHLHKYEWEKAYFYPHGYQVERVTPLKQQIIQVDLDKSDADSAVEPIIVEPDEELETKVETFEIVPAAEVDPKEITEMLTTFTAQLKGHPFLQGEMKKLTDELKAAIKDLLAAKNKDGPYILTRLAYYLDAIVFYWRSHYFPKLAYSTLVRIQFYLGQFKRKKDVELTEHIEKGLIKVRTCLRNYVATACLYLNGISIYAAVCKLNAEFKKMTVEQIVEAFGNMNEMLALKHNRPGVDEKTEKRFVRYERAIKRILTLKNMAEAVERPKKGETLSHYRVSLEEKMRELIPETLYDIGMATFACQAELDTIVSDENSHQFENQNIYINYFKKLAAAVGSHFVEIYSVGTMGQNYQVVQHKIEYLVPILENLLKMFKFEFQFDSHHNPAQDFFEHVYNKSAHYPAEFELPEDESYFARMKKAVVHMVTTYTDSQIVKHIKQYFFFGIKGSLFDILDHLLETDKKTIKDDYDDAFIADLVIPEGTGELHQIRVDTVTAFQEMKKNNHYRAILYFDIVKNSAEDNPGVFYSYFFKQLATRYLYILRKEWTKSSFQNFRLDYDIQDLFKRYGGDMDYLRIAKANDDEIRTILSNEHYEYQLKKPNKNYDPKKMLYLFNYMNPKSPLFRKMVEASAYLKAVPDVKGDKLKCQNVVEFFEKSKPQKKKGVDERIIVFSKTLDKLIKTIRSIPDINELVNPYPLKALDWSQRILRSFKNPVPMRFPFLDSNSMEIKGEDVQNYRLAIVVRLQLFDDANYQELLKYKEKFDKGESLVCEERTKELPLLAGVFN
jgi:hypothetical protein